MCFPKGQEDCGRRPNALKLIQALGSYQSPFELRARLVWRPGEKLRRVGAGAGEKLKRAGLQAGTKVLHAVRGERERVRRVTRWVVTLNFAKFFLPLLLGVFLLILHPHTEIQLGVVAGTLLFSVVFLVATRCPVSTSPGPVTGVQQAPVCVNLACPPSPLLMLYQSLPLPIISSVWGQVASQPLPQPLAFLSVHVYALVTGCDLEEAELPVWEYNSLSQFFTRRLKLGSRPVCPLSMVVSPADGSLTTLARVNGDSLDQVKGVHYSLATFLGMRPEHTHTLFQAVVYLSPADYHRFHSPVSWRVRSRKHFPGSLYSVSPRALGMLPGLFHLQERVAWLGQWQHGFFALVAVGATNVGSIVAEFDPELSTNRRATLSKGKDDYRHHVDYDQPIDFHKGDDFGHFNFGSTIVLIFEAPSDSVCLSLGSKSRVKVGEGLFKESETFEDYLLHTEKKPTTQHV